jgi:hypothetical protein
MRITGQIKCAVVVCLVTVSVASPASATEWPRRLFLVHDVPQTLQSSASSPLHDVAEGPDGRVLVATGGALSVGGDVSVLMPEGGSRTLAHFSANNPLAAGSAFGIGTGAGGAVLAVQALSSEVSRLGPTGEIRAVAGSGKAGFGGDGGPATAAQINPGNAQLAGVTAAVDGSIVFTDTWNNRVRRVRPDGIIETIAGTGPSVGSPGFSCHLAALCMPTDVVAMPDGSVVIVDHGRGRIRRVAADGTMATIAGNGRDPFDPAASDGEGDPATTVPLLLPIGVTRLPDGDVVFSHGSRIARIDRAGRYHEVLRFRPVFFGDAPAEREMADFAGRQVYDAPAGVAATREGGLLMAAGDVYYLAPVRTRRTLVRIHGARLQRRKLKLDIEASRRARASARITRRGRLLAGTARSVVGGENRLELRRQRRRTFGTGPALVSVAVRRPDGATASDTVQLYLGRTLGKEYVKVELAGRFVDETPLRACRRFGARRVDCVYSGARSCEQVVSFTLRRSGVIWWNVYGCNDGSDAFRRDPRFEGAARPLELPVG